MCSPIAMMVQLRWVCQVQPCPEEEEGTHNGGRSSKRKQNYGRAVVGAPLSCPPASSQSKTRRTSTSSAPQCNQPRWRAQIPHLQSGSAAQGFGGFPWPNIIVCQMKGDTQRTAKREPLDISMPLLAEAIQCKWWRHPLWAATCTTHQVVATLTL